MVSIGYPGLVVKGQIVAEPHNLAPGWVGFDFQAAFGRPVKVMNDAAMQALGSYEGGLMLFIGLGTGLGSALVANGAVWPMELGHLSYRKSIYEDYVGLRGLEQLGALRRLVEGYLRQQHTLLCRGSPSTGRDGSARIKRPEPQPQRKQG